VKFASNVCPKCDAEIFSDCGTIARSIQRRRCLAKPRQRFRHRLRRLGSQDCLRSVTRDCS
jgi:hypothetical protein